jgi:spermidine synthase
MGLGQASGVGILAIFCVSFFIMLPVSFTHGGLFTSACRIYANSRKTPAYSVARIYTFETLGSILGGLCFTYLLIPYINAFQVAFIIILFNLPICFLILSNQRNKGCMVLKLLITCLLIITSFLSIGHYPRKLHKLSINRQWKEKVIDYANSIYGNIVVTERNKQYTFFLNGLPRINSPEPDIGFVEEFANIPLLFHPLPGAILVISRGAGGLIQQILKTPSVRSIDYLELDPLILDMFSRHPTPVIMQELASSKVNVIRRDGREFLSNTTLRYDCILIGLSGPCDLQTNRLFTSEFFSLAKQRLKPQGVLAFTLPGSLTYLGKELKDLNACILNSVKEVFRYVRVIPGDYNLFLASNFSAINQTDVEVLLRRIKQRNIRPHLLLPAYLRYRLKKEWGSWFAKQMQTATRRTNEDFRPLAVFKNLVFWSAQFNPWLIKPLNILEKIGLFEIAIIILLTFSCLFCLSRFRFGMVIPLCISTSGFFGMTASLILIFSFQIIYGYIYYQIGMLISVFMAGVATGSILMGRYRDSFILAKFTDRGLFSFLESAIIGVTALLGIVFFMYKPWLPFFFLLCFVAGLTLAAEFPLAIRIYLNDPDKIGEGAGLLYACDLLGAAVAGLFSSIWFLPILGLFNTCIIVVLLKASTLLSLMLLKKR